MYATLTETQSVVQPPRRLEDAEVETLVFVQLNDDPALDQPVRTLPEELTGTYYTG